MPASTPEWLYRARLDVGDRIRSARLHANLTQEGLAERLQVERRTIVRWELGITSPPLDRILETARALGISPRELLPERLDPPPPTS